MVVVGNHRHIMVVVILVVQLGVRDVVRWPVGAVVRVVCAGWLVVMRLMRLSPYWQSSSLLSADWLLVVRIHSVIS